MPNIKLRRVLAFAALHFVALLTAILFALEGLWGMDDPDWTPSLVARVADGVVVVLGQPMMLLWAAIGAGVQYSNVVEWALFVSNSLLWGLGLACLFSWWRARREARVDRSV